MKRVEVPAAEVEDFLKQNAQLAEAKRKKSESEKQDKATKAFLTKWLFDNRQIVLETLPIGEIIIVQIPTPAGFKDVFKIERKNSGNRVDVKRLQNEKPAIATEFTGPTAATYFDACPQS